MLYIKVIYFNFILILMEIEEVKNNHNNTDDNTVQINSGDKELDHFREFRKILNEEENWIGKSEKFGVRFTRKYIPNVLDSNLRLYYTNVRAVSPEQTNTVATLCLVHGFGHYSGEFYEMAFFLAKNGINCHLIDLRGHGYSGGPRFDWTIEDLHTDVLSLIKYAENDSGDLPLFIFGHSLGGGLVASLFINNQYLQVNGVILSAPLLGRPLTVEHDSVKSFILSKLGNNMRDFVVHNNINPSAICKDDREIIRILNDRKIMPLGCPRSFRGMLKICERILENSK